MKLVFYGGGDYEDNTILNKRAIALTGKKNPLITFIPACSYGAEQSFMEFVDGFRPFGLTRFMYFPVDQEFDHVLLREVMKSDLIHLSGGNTYYFLKYLKVSGVFHLLKDFVKRGGVLTGLSAGGIIMTPDIKSAGYPDFDRDDNDEDLKNLKSMGLSKFDFFPHYRNSKRYEDELLKQSKKSNRPIIGVPDGHGVVLENDCLEFSGRAYCFFKGKKIVFN